MKKKWIVIGLVVLLIIWLIWKNRKGSNAHTSTATPNNVYTPTGSGAPSGTNSNTPVTPSCTNTTVLSRGSSCKQQIQWCQYEINRVRGLIGIDKLSQDGVFGNNTEKAFQKLLNKKTGSYAEVFNRVKTLLSLTSLNGTPAGTTINDSIKW